MSCKPLEILKLHNLKSYYVSIPSLGFKELFYSQRILLVPGKTCRMEQKPLAKPVVSEG